MKKAIFFDRDGTLIVDKNYLNDASQIEYFPGIFTALKELREEGFCFFVVTNQSGLARGTVDIKNMKAIHQKMQSDFSSHGIDILNFYYAPYLPSSDHFLRKPNPGMIVEAARDYNINLSESWMVGDKMSDVSSGAQAGTKTILISSDNAVSPEEKIKPDGVFSSVVDAVSFIKGYK